MWENSEFRRFHVVSGIQNLARWAHSQVQNGRETARRVPNPQFGNGDCRENTFKKVCGKSNFHKFSILPHLRHFQAFFAVSKCEITKNLNFPESPPDASQVPSKFLEASSEFVSQVSVATRPLWMHPGKLDKPFKIHEFREFHPDRPFEGAKRYILQGSGYPKINPLSSPPSPKRMWNCKKGSKCAVW